MKKFDRVVQKWLIESHDAMGIADLENRQRDLEIYIAVEVGRKGLKPLCPH